MLFNSFAFIVFFLGVMVIYYLPFFKKIQPQLLIIASFYFYATVSVKATFLLLFSILINAILSYLVLRSNRRKAIFYASIGVIINLGTLCFFKYVKLFTITFVPEKFVNDPIYEFLVYLPLPVGISFFTFEGISLLIDTLKKKEVAQTSTNNFYQHLSNTSLFITYFPHLIAGPILKADHYIPQIKSKYFKDIHWENALKYLILGYFFKVVIADNIKEQTYDLAFPFDYYHPISLLFMAFGYSIQIFTDFAGYSIIALGISSLLGYELIKNFNYPYISTSFSEFWSRWHISLSSWLKEYLYIPIGGNRKGSLRTYLNLFIVMLLGGLWHGATWNFAIWGMVHGIALLIERLITNHTKPIKSTIFQIFKGMLVFSVVTLAWLFFKLADFHEVVLFYQSLAQNNWSGFYIGEREFYILIYAVPVFIYYGYYLVSRNAKYSSLHKNKLELMMYSLMLFSIITNTGFGGSFIYFRF